MRIRLFHVKILYADSWSKCFKLKLKQKMRLDSAFSFHYSPMLILLMVRASNNAANRKRMTTVNSISYWLSLAQLKINATCFIAFRMHSLSHKSLFHGTYRLRRLTAFGFVSLIPKTNPWFVVSDADKRQKRKMWYQRARYVVLFLSLW